MSEAVDVVVVGAGFTGLSAATSLVERGRSCLVLEARDRVGGRVESAPNTLGERVDTGGQFLCDDMPVLLALARERGVRLIETRMDGAFLTDPPMPDEAAERCYVEATVLRDRVKRWPADNHRRTGSTVADWLARQPESADGKDAFRAMIEGLWCVALERLPAWYLASNDRRVTNIAHELQYALAGTMHGLAEGLASDLGDRLRVGVSAESIEHGERGVRVVTDGSGATGPITARAVVVAVPPATAARIAYAPPLPAATARALSAWQSGAVVKVLLRYRRAFWRERGLSGMVAWRRPSGLFVFDASPDDDCPTLAFFLGGPLALEWHRCDEADIRNMVTGRLADSLGPEAAEPLDVTIRDWTHDRWSGGAYSDVVTDLDAVDAEDVLRTGVPPLFFAASELSPSYPGYIEGAIVAGGLAAETVATYLAGQLPIATRASGS